MGCRSKEIVAATPAPEKPKQYGEAEYQAALRKIEQGIPLEPWEEVGLALVAASKVGGC